MIINFYVQVAEFQLDNTILYKEWLNKIAGQEEKVIKEIDYIFVDDISIVSINKRYLHHNYPTDIIAFDNSYLNTVSGEIYVCVPAIKRNANIYSKGNFIMELNRVLVHGLLHLLGYRDKTIEQREIMHEKEDCYLKYLE